MDSAHDNISLGQAALERHDFDKAEEPFRQAWQATPSALAAFWLSEVSRELGRIDDALSWIQKAHSIDANDDGIKCAYAGCLYHKARAAFEHRKFADAVTLLSQSWQLHPHAHTAFMIARACQSLQQQDHAGVWLQRANAQNPAHSQIAVAYATHLFETGNSSEAARIAEDVLLRNATFKPAAKLLERLRNQT